MRRPWTPEEEAELRRLYPSHDNQTIGNMLGRTEPAIQGRANKLGLRKPPGFVNVGCFLPGQETWNKGMKGWKAGGRSAETRFKKGQKPHTWHPIGHERITDDGYLQRKMTDTRCTRRDYVNVHWLLWIEHYGPIPPGHLIVFKDRNPRNIAIENLECINRIENMRRNTVHNLPKPLAQLVQLRGVINRKINQATKKEKAA